jgi:hypothetical protein
MTFMHRYLHAVFRYTESMFRRDGISILTQHHVERVEAVRVFPMLMLAAVFPLTSRYFQGRMFVREQGEGNSIHIISRCDPFNTVTL